jgi:hypothetical protein
MHTTNPTYKIQPKKSSNQNTADDPKLQQKSTSLSFKIFVVDFTMGEVIEYKMC